MPNASDKSPFESASETVLLKKRIQEMEQSLADYRQAEEKLKESERRFRAIADYTPDWENWIGPDGKVLWVNPRVLEVTGYTVEECLNMVDFPIAIFDEADKKRMSLVFSGAVEGSSGSNVEFRIICKDGRRKWVSVSWQPIFDEKSACNLGHRSSLRDVDAFKLLEAQLQNATERLEAMLNALPDMMFRVDGEGCIHECHSLDVDRFYIPPSLFIGKKMADVLPEEAAQIIMGALNEAAVSGRHQGACYSLHLPKGTCWYEISVAVMGGKKQPGNQFVALVRDITDRKQLQDELQQASAELEVRVLQRTAQLAEVMEALKVREKLLAAESQSLQEANTALKVLLRQREEDQQDMEKKVLANVRNLVMPYVEKLNVTPLTTIQAGYLDIISNNLQNIISPFLRNLTATYMNFTPREIDVAHLVREGKSAKEIAMLLNCSLRSVEFHKDNVRRKLGLTHEKINLRSYLLSLNASSSG